MQNRPIGNSPCQEDKENIQTNNLDLQMQFSESLTEKAQSSNLPFQSFSDNQHHTNSKDLSVPQTKVQNNASSFNAQMYPDTYIQRSSQQDQGSKNEDSNFMALQNVQCEVQDIIYIENQEKNPNYDNIDQILPQQCGSSIPNNSNLDRQPVSNSQSMVVDSMEIQQPQILNNSAIYPIQTANQNVFEKAPNSKSSIDRRRSKSKVKVYSKLSQFLNCPKEMKPSKSLEVIDSKRKEQIRIQKKYRSSVESVRRSRDSANATATGANYINSKQNDAISLVLSRQNSSNKSMSSKSIKKSKYQAPKQSRTLIISQRNKSVEICAIFPSYKKRQQAKRKNSVSDLNQNDHNPQFITQTGCLIKPDKINDVDSNTWQPVVLKPNGSSIFNNEQIQVQHLEVQSNVQIDQIITSSSIQAPQILNNSTIVENPITNLQRSVRKLSLDQDELTNFNEFHNFQSDTQRYIHRRQQIENIIPVKPVISNPVPQENAGGYSNLNMIAMQIVENQNNIQIQHPAQAAEEQEQSQRELQSSLERQRLQQQVQRQIDQLQNQRSVAQRIERFNILKDQWEQKFINHYPTYFEHEYENSILKVLLDEENNPKKRIGYHFQNEMQPIINELERAQLINWLVKLHNKIIGPRQETLHIAVNIIDRILPTNSIGTNDLETLGITAFLIASKFEDIIQPTSFNLCDLDRSRRVNPVQVQQLERNILSYLDFDVQFPTTYRFYEFFCNQVSGGSKHQLLGQFVLEIILLESNIIQNNKCSIIAMAALYLVSQRIYKHYPSSQTAQLNFLKTQELINLNDQTQTFHQRVDRLARQLEYSEKHSLLNTVFQETRKKYQEDKDFKKISRLILPQNFRRQDLIEFYVYPDIPELPNEAQE